MKNLRINKPVYGPLLLEGHGLQSEDGRLALCIGMRDIHVPSHVQEQPTGSISITYEYDMFDEGDMWTMKDKDVRDAIEAGSRVIIVDI